MADRASNSSAAGRTKAQLDAITIGGAWPLQEPVQLVEYDGRWPALYEREAARIVGLLGSALVRIEHVGSTSVPQLAAKPIIDIVMEVPDSKNEVAYVAPLAAHGYELRIREPDWFQHRMLRGSDTDINLHVFTRGCSEVERMVRFRDYLRQNLGERLMYEAVKRELVKHDWAFMQHYADAKGPVIETIMSRANQANLEASR